MMQFRFQGGKEMQTSYTSVILSAVETEAVVHFSLIVRLTGYEGGRFGPLKIYEAFDGHAPGTKVVRIDTSFNDDIIRGAIVLRNEDGQWRTYVAASDIDYGDCHVSFSYDKEMRAYNITKYYKDGQVEPMTVNMITGERTVYANPAD